MEKPRKSEAHYLVVWNDRKWPAHFTVEQMRAQLRHEENGCPPPFPGAVWNGYCYIRGAAK